MGGRRLPTELSSRLAQTRRDLAFALGDHAIVTWVTLALWVRSFARLRWLRMTGVDVKRTPYQYLSAADREADAPKRFDGNSGNRPRPGVA